MASDAGPPAVRVLLCDDAVGFPELVASWLGHDPRTELVAGVGNVTDLWDALAASRPDVVLLDFMLPEGATDPGRVARIRALVPAVRVVLVSSLPPIELEHEARRVGAEAWCPKATKAGRLIAAILG